eukprot:m.196985 g.196985  ORF g.196985 m.196985 type:complete len:91 (-) comp17020_c0_seq2:162-434(-)
MICMRLVRRPCLTRGHPNSLLAGLKRGDRPKLVQTAKSPRDFARFPGIAGCTVNMLTGKPCAMNVEMTPERTAQAIKTVQEAAFVGITDE